VCPRIIKKRRAGGLKTESGGIEVKNLIFEEEGWQINNSKGISGAAP